MHKQGACAAGEASVMGRRQGADCAASRSRRSAYSWPRQRKGTVRVPVMRTALLFTTGLFPVDWG